jgi:hypothetical protein
MGPPEGIQDLQDTVLSFVIAKGKSYTLQQETLGTTLTTLQKSGDSSVAYKRPQNKSYFLS